MAKMNKKWVALCSTAIVAVYTAGYWTTEAEKPNELTSPIPHVQAANSNSVSSPISSKYNDGTYTGTGSNRRGTIQVKVAITNDQITDVEISDFAMHYTIDDIAGMPNEVLRIQTADVKNVSGATYSTRAFSDAVQDALNLALRS
ncbi:FMN-binding protein [Paenibacillus sp. GCM10012306]|uniref:FMN-binding protein n=1 Tax=Paenibacillus sp. GCM10012306 TaxID=3317342 RepID=UPI00361B20C7